MRPSRLADAATAAALLLALAGCATDVVEFSTTDGAVPDLQLACMVSEIQFGVRCQICQAPGQDAEVQGRCYKLGCKAMDVKECKECWWSDTPSDLCYICSRDGTIFKDTCHQKPWKK